MNNKKRKKFLILIGFVVMLGCCACNRNEDETKNVQETIDESEESIEEEVATQDGENITQNEENATQEELPVEREYITYTTKYGEVNKVSCPSFKFDYPDNWHIAEEIMKNGVVDEQVILENDKGSRIVYMDMANKRGLGSDGRTMYAVEASKIADSRMRPSYPDGTDKDFSYLGDFMVAEVKEVGWLDMDTDEDFTKVDGTVWYAVVPESYIGNYNVVGEGGLYTKFSFEYPSLYCFIGKPAEGDDSLEEMIEILSSFRVG